MPTPAIPLAEFDQEIASTRALLERVPDDRLEWKPHERSFPLGHLAQLVAWIPGWIARTLHQPFIDIAGGRYTFMRSAELVAELDRNAREAREALASVTGGALEEPWSLKAGGRVLYTSIRGAVARNHLSHLIHHRGQLTVYLRLLDVPVSAVYGPTADDKSFQAPAGAAPA